jgi:hypothetical protein
MPFMTVLTWRRFRLRSLDLTRRGAIVSFVLPAFLSVTYPAIATARSSFHAQRPAPSEKESRTPAQQKINSQLLYEVYRFRGEAKQKNVPPDPTGVKLDAKGRALVDVRAEVTAALQESVRTLGGTIESSSAQYRSIIAWVPLNKLERLAADPAVRAIEPAAPAFNNK